MKNSFSSLGIYPNLNYNINQKRNFNIISPVLSDIQIIKLSCNTINTNNNNFFPNQISSLYNYNSSKYFNKNIFNKEKKINNKDYNIIKTKNYSLRKYNKNSDIQFMNLKIRIDIAKNKLNQLSDYNKTDNDINKIPNQKSFINLYNNEIKNFSTPKIINTGSTLPNSLGRNNSNLFYINNNYHSNKICNSQKLINNQNNENPINNKFNINNYYIKYLNTIKNNENNDKYNKQKSSEDLSLLANDIISSFKITDKSYDRLQEKKINLQTLNNKRNNYLNNNKNKIINNKNNINNNKSKNLNNNEININTNKNNKEIINNSSIKNKERNTNINNTEIINNTNSKNNEINYNKNNNQESYIEIPQIEEPFSTDSCNEYFQDTIDSKDSIKKKNIFLENNNVNTISNYSNNSNNNNNYLNIKTIEISDLSFKTEESQFSTGRKKTEDNFSINLNENKLRNENLTFKEKNKIEIKDNFTQTETFDYDGNGKNKYTSEEEDNFFDEIIEKSKELEKLIESNKKLCDSKKKKNIIYFPNKNKKGMKPNFLSYHKKK